MLLVNRVLLGIVARILRLRVLGREHLPERGPVLVVANHVAFIDPALVAIALFPRRSWGLGKEELARNPAARFWLMRSGMIPLKRASADFAAMRTARRLLREGEWIVLFPEGQVTRSGMMRPGFPGAGFLALAPGVTVVPAAVANVRQRGQRNTVLFGPPVPLDDLRAAPGRVATRAATERMMAAIAAMLPAVGGPAQDGPVGVAALGGDPAGEAPPA